MSLSALPKVDRVLDAEALAEPLRRLGRRAVRALVRDVLAVHRERVRGGSTPPSESDVALEVAGLAAARARRSLTPVINATGVVLHTNLGRAPLPKASLDAIAQTAGVYSALEMDVELGARTQRGLAVELALAELTGAEDALIVNNNAAAVLLCLSTLGAGREVIVSRGELVEIGGGFRIPDVLARSGARLVEVGTTNRTRAQDYARAITERTACLLRVHPSNFKITGFTERPSLAELVAVAHAHDVPLVKDLGGGLVHGLSDEVLAAADLEREPTVERCLATGADLVCFSLDKLFGGPQGGGIVGSGPLVERLRRDPLARALRVDKLTIAALEPVLAAHGRGDGASIPVVAMIAARRDDLRKRVEGWRVALGDLGSGTECVDTAAAVGGGTLAEAPLASAALALPAGDADGLARALREASPPVVARIADGRVLLDARTVLPDQDAALVGVLRAILAAAG